MSANQSLNDQFSVSEFKAISALVVDDSDIDRKRIRRFCQKSSLPIHIDEVRSVSELKEALTTRQRYDLIFLDYQLTDGDGLSALELVQTGDLQNETGVIMITGNQGRDLAVSAFRKGCHDIISKDEMSSETLRHSMLRTLKRLESQKIEKMVQERLREDVQNVVMSSLDAAQIGQAMARTMIYHDRPNPTELEMSHHTELHTYLQDFLSDDEFHFDD